VSFRDLGGVFSRYFVVGFFVPAFLALAAVMLTASSDLLPKQLEKPTGGAFAAVGVAAVALGLVLTGLNYPLQRLLEGYGFKLPYPGRGFRFLCWIGAQMTKLEKRRYRRLRNLLAGQTRPAAARLFERQFPHKESDVLPTRLGNALRAFERHGQGRWGLDAIVVWPHVEALMTEAEVQAHENDQGTFAFFLNGSLCSFAAGVVIVADAIAYRDPPLWTAALLAVPFAVSYLLYRGAVVAAQQWGSRVRASLDLHRLDLYRKLGLRLPRSRREEIDLGKAVTSALRWGKTQHLDWFRDPKAGAGEDEKAAS
jgi:hypothetical protein